MLERIIPFAHKKISEYVTENDIAVDMTAGNGNDTLYLSSIAKHVYAFDIQENAIATSKSLLDKHHVSNVSLIHDSHINVSQYVKDSVSVAVFNLGYLPNGDKSITTTASTTLQALDALLPLMKKQSLISITIYIGHEQGIVESNMVKEYAMNLPSNQYNVLLYSMLNKNNAPYNIFIEKIGE